MSRRPSSGRRHRRCAVLFTLAIAASAHAADLPQRQSLGRITADEGLSHLNVFSVLQDRDGFIWIATQDGLNRWDGHSMTVFRSQPGEQGGLSSSDTSTLLVDRSGALWVGTWRGGLNRLDPATGRFEAFASDPGSSSALHDDRIQALFEHSSGTLWIGSYSGGLSRLESDGRSFTTYLPDPDDPTTISDTRVWAIAEDSEGMLWVGTALGLNRLDPATGRFTRYLGGSHDPALRPPVRALHVDRDGVLWVGTEHGLMSFDRRLGAFLPFDARDGGGASAPLYGPVNAILQDRQGRLWVGLYGAGLCCVDLEARPELDTGRAVHWSEDPGRRDALAHGDVRSLMEDRTGVLWIGTRGGGVHTLDLRPRRFHHVAPRELNDPAVWALHVDRGGTLWVGTQRGLDRRDPGQELFTHYRYESGDPDGLPAGNVNALHEDSQGRLWVGTWGGGLSWFDREHDRFVSVAHDALPEGSANVTLPAIPTSTPATTCSGSRPPTATVCGTRRDPASEYASSLLRGGRGGRTPSTSLPHSAWWPHSCARSSARWNARRRSAPACAGPTGSRTSSWPTPRTSSARR